MRTFLIVLSVIGIFLLGYWMKGLRRENIRLESRVERVETQVTNKQQQTQSLQRERQRLDQLRDTLNEVVRAGVQPPTGSIDAHVSNLTRRISTLENELRSLGQESQAVSVNAQTYRQQTRQQAIDQQLALQRQIQDINDQIARLQDLGANPADIDPLILNRNQLQAQIQMIRTAVTGQALTATQAAQSEQVDIRAERETLQTQLEDLRTDLAFWRNLREDRAPAAQPARVQELQEQIRAQEARLDALDRQIRTR